MQPYSQIKRFKALDAAGNSGIPHGRKVITQYSVDKIQTAGTLFNLSWCEKGYDIYQRIGNVVQPCRIICKGQIVNTYSWELSTVACYGRIVLIWDKQSTDPASGTTPPAWNTVFNGYDRNGNLASSVIAGSAAWNPIHPSYRNRFVLLADKYFTTSTLEIIADNGNPLVYESNGSTPGGSGMGFNWDIDLSEFRSTYFNDGPSHIYPSEGTLFYGHIIFNDPNISTQRIWEVQCLTEYQFDDL